MKNSIVLIFLLLIAVALIVIGLQLGSFETSLSDVMAALFKYDKGNTIHYSIVQLRFPRILIALLVGASLAFSGYLMQAMVNNPLADPYILGTSSGASLGASFVYLLAVPVFGFSFLVPSVFAFAGALLITSISVVIAHDKGSISPVRLLLGGVAVSSLSVSLISILIYLSNEENKLRSVIYWSMGSFESARWEYVPLLLITLILCLGFFWFIQKSLNTLLVGESRAENLGVNIRKLRWQVLIGSSLLTACAVASSGPVGFVGLIIPHVVRALFGIHGRLNIVFTILIGGDYLLACDIFSRYIYPPSGIPTGIITSFIGIPFFIWLLIRKKYHFS